MASNIFTQSHIRDQSILAEDFEPQALTFAHLNGLVPINKGGTNATSFSTIGGLLTVSNNRIISSPTFRWLSTGFGVNTASPEGQLHINVELGVQPLHLKTTGLKKAGVILNNDIGDWFVGVLGGALKIIDQQGSKDVFTFNISSAPGKIGIGTAPG